jgi:hypothetical protein
MDIHISLKHTRTAIMDGLDVILGKDVSSAPLSTTIRVTIKREGEGLFFFTNGIYKIKNDYAKGFCNLCVKYKGVLLVTLPGCPVVAVRALLGLEAGHCDCHGI